MENIIIERVISKWISKDWKYHNYYGYDNKFNAYDITDRKWFIWHAIDKTTDFLFPTMTRCGKLITLDRNCEFI